MPLYGKFPGDLGLAGTVGGGFKRRPLSPDRSRPAQGAPGHSGSWADKRFKRDLGRFGGPRISDEDKSLGGLGLGGP